MNEEATTAETISFEDCERLLGHCWNSAFYLAPGDGSHQQACLHCGATRKQTMSDWVTSPPEPRDGAS